MAFSRENEFLPAERLIANICKAFSHPARVRILCKLIHKKGFTSHEELIRDIPLAPTTISQHISMLRHLNLIHSQNASKLNSTEHSINHKISKSAILLNFIASYAHSRHEPNGADIKVISKY